MDFHKRDDDYQMKYKLAIDIFVFVSAFIFSWLFAPFHFGGDAVHYNDAYNIVKDKSIIQAYLAYLTEVYSKELIHFLLIYLFSNMGIEKLLFTAILNASLATLLYRFMTLLGFKWWVAILLLTTNYYLYALFFTLEKLKVAVFFGVLAIYARYIWNVVRIPVLFFVFSLLAHFQMFIIAGSHLFGKVAKFNFYTLRSLLVVFVLGVFSMLVLYYYGEFISYKLEAYLSSNFLNSLIDFLKIFLFGLVVFYFNKLKFSVFLSYFFLAVIAFFIGAERISMFAYAYLYYLYAFAPKGNGFLILMISPYLLYKSVNYLIMVYTYGG